jgi:hypothetical protein
MSRYYELAAFLKRRIFWTLSLALLVAPASSAQTPADGGPDPAVVRVRLGPLWLNPTISMPNIGIDTNVFNDPLNVTPRKDFTFDLLPKAELWLRMGRTWLFGTIGEEVIWYQKYSTERSVNSTYSIGWKAPLNRVVLTGSAARVSTKARPGFEIDVRAQRTEPLYAGSVEVRGFAKTFLGVRGSWNQVRFEEDAVFNGSSLQEQLDRTVTTAAITLRHELTPLTSLTFSAGRSEQRFKSAPLRNSTSADYTVGLLFDPAALIRGSATVGYKLYKPEASDLEGYRGSSAAASLTYILLGSTRISGGITRDVEFSYDVNQPYYLLTGGTVSIAQQVFGPVDVVARGGANRLKYQSRTGAILAEPDRTDHVRFYGFGFGTHLGQDVRLGFNIDRERRTSVLAEREYKGLRYGSSLTYGL